MNESGENELQRLHEQLIPILSKATLGDFSSTPAVSSANSVRTNELLAGVGVLLEVIREKIDELERANAALEEAHNRSLHILDDVLTKSLERDNTKIN